MCIIADDDDRGGEAKQAGYDFVHWGTVERWNKDKFKVCELVAKYDAFLICSDVIKEVPRAMGPWLTKAGKAPVALGPKDEIPKAVEKLQKEIAKKRKEDSPILRFLGSNLLTRSSFYEDDKEEIEMMLLYELPEGNLEKFLWQRWLTLTGHEAFIGACQQLARGSLTFLFDFVSGYVS